MSRILITGATGNIGIEVINYLFTMQTQHEIFAGVRNTDAARKLFSAYSSLRFLPFDFEQPETFRPALQNIDTVFLLRPPHISDVNQYFKPLIHEIKQCGIGKIVFLSVQGVEKSSVIPHNKIEKLIISNKLDYVFLRPSYFMQNLSTTLYSDIKNKQQIILPAGKAKFNWVDIRNIAEVAAIVLDNFDIYKNNAFDITGYENENFYKIQELFSEALNLHINYNAVNPLHFYFIKKREKIPQAMILVMIMLHFLPRFQREPEISNFYEQVTGKQPTTIKEFLNRERFKFIK